MEYIDRKELSTKLINYLVSIQLNFFLRIDVPLVANQWITLNILYFDGPLTSTELGSRLSISKQQVFQIINKLYKDGYVNRQTTLEDRRCKNIMLTEKGNKILMNGKNALNFMIEKNTDILTDLEIVDFSKAIEVLVPLFEKIYD